MSEPQLKDRYLVKKGLKNWEIVLCVCNHCKIYTHKNPYFLKYFLFKNIYPLTQFAYSWENAELNLDLKNYCMNLMRGLLQI